MPSLSDIRRSFGPLGWTAFGGPAAHMGYFHTEFVDRKQWVEGSTYADLVALSQFLPGPGSSKVGMALGYHRAGLVGMAYSWFWFTFPSALIMAVFGLALGRFDFAHSGWIAGLLAAAVGVVLHAVTGMARKLLYSQLTWAIAIATFAALFWVPQIAPLVVAGILGALLVHSPADAATASPHLRPVSARLGWGCVIAFFGLLGLLQLGSQFLGGWWLTRMNAFYQSGALVFGGGHVVLPLLEGRFVESGWLSQADFLSGYSLAQAMPGPLFTFATYVGAVDGGVVGAVLGTLFIFLPGALLTLAGLYFWGSWRHSARMRGAFAGINAAVVGLLAHALWDPITVHGVTGWATGLIAAAVFVALQFFKAPPWSIAVGAATAGMFFL